MPRPGPLTAALLCVIAFLTEVVVGPMAQAAVDVRFFVVRIAPTSGTSPYLGDPSPYDVVVSDDRGRPVVVDVALDVVGGQLGSAATVSTDSSGSVRVVVVPSQDEVTVTATVVDPSGAPGARAQVTSMVRHRFATLPTAIVQGVPVVGEVLSAAPAGGVPEPTQTTYLWLVGWTSDPLGGELVRSGPTYAVREADVGKPVRLLVLAQRPYYDTANVWATPTAPVIRRRTPLEVSAPRTAVAGRRVRVGVAGAVAGEVVAFSLGNRLVAQAVAGAQPGLLSVRFKVPRRLAGQQRTISVRTIQTERSGEARLRIMPTTRGKARPAGR